MASRVKAARTFSACASSASSAKQRASVMSPASGSVEELPKPDFAHRAQHRTDGDLERDSLRAELGGVVELPDAMRGLMVELTRREARRHAYRPGNVPDRIAHAMHASDVLQTSPARRSGPHEIRVLRHPEEARAVPQA